MNKGVCSEEFFNFVFFIFRERSYYVSQVDLKLMVFLLQFPVCQG